MNPGRLRNRIEIQEKQTIRDPDTKLPIEKWVALHKCWAQIYQPRGRNFYQAAVAHKEYITWFNIRDRDGIEPGMRVLFKNRRYEVEQVNPDFQHQKTMALQCREVV